MDNEEHSGPLTSLEGTDGKVPDSKYDNKYSNNFQSGPGGILVIAVILIFVFAIAHYFGLTFNNIHNYIFK
ncbi:MAG: hypothetical protein WCU00_04200 [Candidatus Latescibacterota bacterium]